VSHHRFAGELQRPQVGAVGIGDRRRDRHDDEIGFRKRCRIRGEARLAPLARVARGKLIVRKVAAAKTCDENAVDVVRDRRQPLAEFDRERQADVAEADDGDARQRRRRAHRV
jgi:hypothetical protein